MSNHLITYAVLNISSDVLIMCLPLPLVFKVSIPRKNKLIITSVLLVTSSAVCLTFLNPSSIWSCQRTFLFYSSMADPDNKLTQY